MEAPGTIGVDTAQGHRRHYASAVTALEQADAGWRRRLITRRVFLADFPDAFTHRGDDVKVVLETEGP